MSSLNKAQIIGNLGQEPEIRYTKSGSPVANLSIATSEKWKDKQSGEPREATEWHRVVLFGRQAEVAAEYLHQGSKVYIEGQIKTRKWQDQQGQDKYTTEIHGRQLIMLNKVEGQPQSTQQQQPPAQNGSNQPAGNFDDFDDDIPF